MEPFLIAIAVIVILLVSLLVSAIKVVREYQRLVVFRLGRVIGTKGPGLVILIPLVDRATLVDLREFYLEIPHQTAITEDNASISIGNFAGAAQNIASTTLRSVVGDMSLDDVLAKREQMNEVLRVKLDEVTERWGVKVTNVEIREIIPPPAVQEAMTRQMSAERTRRAVVTEAEGSKQAAITVSEGNKQAAILNAEGERQSSILRAEGARQAAILNAEGFAMALQKINEAAADVGTNTMRLQYLDALKALGVSPSSKVVVPMELSGLVAAFTAITSGGANGDGNGAAKT
jgi:regulator of protease activity HflC (stomatin/prohibitin superfamily)